MDKSEVGWVKVFQDMTVCCRSRAVPSQTQYSLQKKSIVMGNLLSKHYSSDNLERHILK